MDYKKLLMELMKTFGPSGYEKPVATLFCQEMEKTADHVETDRAGNVIARYDGTNSSSPVIMAYAHMDSIGFIVRKIEEDGFIGLDRLGGVPEKVLPGKALCVQTTDGQLISGVIGGKSHHAVSPDEKYLVNKITELYLDIGASNSAHAREIGLEVGCPATYQPSAIDLAGNFISGTFLDNRGGLVALAVAGELLKNNRPESTVYLVGTVWEEFNLRGATLAARSICPEIAISLDAVLTGDTRDMESRYETSCGKGPVLVHYTFHGRGTLNGTLAHNGLSRLAVKSASEKRKALQHFAGIGILTDSAYVQLENEGPAALELGFPVRYTHTPTEVANVSDIQLLGELLAEVIFLIDPCFDLKRY